MCGFASSSLPALISGVRSRAVPVFVYRVKYHAQPIERRETAQAEACGSEHRNGKCSRVAQAHVPCVRHRCPASHTYRVRPVGDRPYPGWRPDDSGLIPGDSLQRLGRWLIMPTGVARGAGSIRRGAGAIQVAAGATRSTSLSAVDDHIHRRSAWGGSTGHGLVSIGSGADGVRHRRAAIGIEVGLAGGFVSKNTLFL